MNRLKGSRRLESEVTRYFQHWYHIAIRELIQSEAIFIDSKSISEKIEPSISEEQASNALQVLLELGMIEKDEKKGYRVIDRLLRTDKEVDYLAISKFYLEMVDNSKKALEFLQSDERDISAITLTVKTEDMDALKKEIQNFRQIFLTKYDRSDGQGERVYQLNLQLFPLTSMLRKNSNE